MRPSAVPAILLAALILSGCAASSGAEDVLTPVPSRETTNAITQPSGPIPAAAVGDPAPQASPPQQALSWTGEVPEPQALVPADRPVGMPMPTEKPVALLMPTNPAGNAMPDIGTRSPTRGQIYGHHFRDAKPINFGSTSPRKLAVHGVDVSRWQGEIDWETLRRQGANFVYIKATDGGDHLDPMFKKNWRRAKEAGLKHGAYHFFYWCRTAGEQADWFIRNVPREANALPPVIDVEWNGESSCKRRISPTRVREKMQVFMDKLERYYGQRPIIYTAPDFYRDNLKGQLLDYPFWLRSVAAHPSKVYPGRKWLFWQYSGSGLSDGVDGKIDLNVFNGNESDWHDWVASR
ncbi:glycoside hydrolase family 25 protein [Rhizobium leguminosarum]|uniref:Glycosyl hydrolase n=1 Tax=Rhizobium leguminosarum TaxID=384 RepID=A0A2K9Z3N9_RHILE|nr:GH25 family lysozyme [Rhizobium leguminosarum]AUW42721.1 Glycosyl hydrolase [Rhizobium leguminosarum]